MQVYWLVLVGNPCSLGSKVSCGFISKYLADTFLQLTSSLSVSCAVLAPLLSRVHHHSSSQWVSHVTLVWDLPHLH